MIKSLLSGLVLAASLAATALAQDGTGDAKSGRVEVDGVSYYYEIQGTGEPLLLLHGGLGSFDMFKPVLPTLAKGAR